MKVSRNHIANLLNPNAVYLNSKFKFLDHLVRKQPPNRDNKLIVVSYYTSTLELVEKYFKSQRIKYTTLTGKLSAKIRDGNVKKFLNQDPGAQVHVFLLGAKAGGTGLNLVQCQRMIMMDVDWNPGNDRQVVGRIWRKGQKKPVQIYRLVLEGTVEEVVVARQKHKEELASMIYSGGRMSKGPKLDMKDLLKRWTQNSIFRRDKHALHTNSDPKKKKKNELVYQMDRRWNMIGETIHTMFSRVNVRFENEELWHLNGIPQGLIQIIESVLLGDEESEGLEIGKIQKVDTKRQVLRIKTTQEIEESQETTRLNGGYVILGKFDEDNLPKPSAADLGLDDDEDAPTAPWKAADIAGSSGDEKPTYIFKKKKKKFKPPKKLDKPKPTFEQIEQQKAIQIRNRERDKFFNERLVQDPNVATFNFGNAPNTVNNSSNNNIYGQRQILFQDKLTRKQRLEQQSRSRNPHNQPREPNYGYANSAPQYQNHAPGPQQNYAQFNNGPQ
jgi:hypothetical protein